MTEQGAIWGEQRVNFMSTVHNAVTVFEKNETLTNLGICYGHEHATARGISSIKM